MWFTVIHYYAIVIFNIKDEHNEGNLTFFIFVVNGDLRSNVSFYVSLDKLHYIEAEYLLCHSKTFSMIFFYVFSLLQRQLS